MAHRAALRDRRPATARPRLLEGRPTSEIGFSRTWEDPEVVRRVVERLEKARSAPLRVGVVASGGCGALALAAQRAVGRIDAIDLSRAQLHLLELKRQAAVHLPLDEQRLLLGATPPDEDDADARWDLYQRLRFALPEDVREHFDARQAEVRYGLLRVGRFEGLLFELAEAFRAEGVDPLGKPADALGNPAWRSIFERIFQRSKLEEAFGPSAVVYSTERSFAAHFSGRFADALRAGVAKESGFFAWAFSDEPGEDALPYFLTEKAQQAMREHGLDRLHLHHGPFLGRILALAEEHGPFDLLDLSDVLDWLPMPERRAALRKAASVLSEGGVLLARRLNGDGSLSDLMRRHLIVDRALSAELFEQERSFLYAEVVAGFSAR